MRLPIALDHRPALLSCSGIGRATRELARALAERPDLDVHLFGHSFARCAVPGVVPPNATLHRLPIPGRSLPFFAKFGLGADRLAGRVPVFHWLDYVQPPVSRAKCVLTVHDLAFVRDPTWHGADAAVLRERTAQAIGRAAALIVPSHATAADLRAFAPDAPRAHVVPFGGDHVVRVPRADPWRGRPFVLCVGTVEPRKNHLTLLRAWARLREPRPLLVVVGRAGWECETIVAELRAAARTGAVEWRDDADDDEAMALLQNARALVYPSLWEGFGFPPLEAMRLGVPVVANDIAPLRELCDDAALLVDATDPATLAAAIDRVLADDAERTRLSDAGRARAACFSWRAAAAAHAAIYHEVAR